jgi:phage terminase large subunit
MIQTMDNLRYRWGTDWLPHDATQHHPTSGTNAEKMIRELTGRSPRVIPRTDPEARIRAARMMFPRIYLDDGKRDTPPDRPDRLLGGAYLMDRLKRYRRHIPKTTGEPATPEHDINSHGSDAFGALAEIVERIRDESYEFMPDVPRFRNKDVGMGMLG